MIEEHGFANRLHENLILAGTEINGAEIEGVRAGVNIAHGMEMKTIGGREDGEVVESAFISRD